jgi:hypothetical protein
VGLRDHGETERVRHPVAVRLAISGEVEHRLDQRLERERGPHLADEAGLDVAAVPEAVRGARLDDDHVARTRHEPLAPDLHADRALDDLEALRLVRVHVRRGDDAARAHRALDEHVLAVGRRGRLDEGEPLARDLVLEGLADGDHCCPPCPCDAPVAPLGAASRGVRPGRMSPGSASRREPSAGFAGTDVPGVPGPTG